jgi:plasmid stabilization system protein ParE
MTNHVWTVRLSDTAAADYDEILRWTVRRFGAQVRVNRVSKGAGGTLK